MSHGKVEVRDFGPSMRPLRLYFADSEVVGGGMHFDLKSDHLVVDEETVEVLADVTSLTLDFSAKGIPQGRMERWARDKVTMHGSMGHTFDPIPADEPATLVSEPIMLLGVAAVPREQFNAITEEIHKKNIAKFGGV